jgi:hypothetical protein
MRGATMDITTIVFNGALGGLAAIVFIFTCDLIASLMKSKERVCATSEKGTNQ